MPLALGINAERFLKKVQNNNIFKSQYTVFNKLNKSETYSNISFNIYSTDFQAVVYSFRNIYIFLFFSKIFILL